MERLAFGLKARGGPVRLNHSVKKILFFLPHSDILHFDPVVVRIYLFMSGSSD